MVGLHDELWLIVHRAVAVGDNVNGVVLQFIQVLLLYYLLHNRIRFLKEKIGVWILTDRIYQGLILKGLL